MSRTMLRLGLVGVTLLAAAAVAQACSLPVFRVALLDPASVNAGVTVFLEIKTDQHNLDWLEAFRAAILDLPEIVEAYRMSGEVDYLLRVVVPDIAAYDAFYKRLI